jgi:LCP family protein required for cell wall assembly
MIIASYNKKTGKIVLSSCLRDSYVPIENRGWRKLNASFPLGGIGLTINTINQIYNLDIQRYITVDFDGFVKIVDILEGVEVDVSELEAEALNKTYHLNLSPGVQTLDGKTALCYSRIRKGAGDDYARTARQRKVITAALNKMFNTRNPAKVTKLVSEGVKYVKTNLGLNEIYSLISGFMSLESMNIDSVQIPASGMFTTQDVKIGNDTVNVLVVDFDKTRAYVRQKIYG